MILPRKSIIYGHPASRYRNISSFSAPRRRSTAGTFVCVGRGALAQAGLPVGQLSGSCPVHVRFPAVSKQYPASLWLKTNTWRALPQRPTKQDWGCGRALDQTVRPRESRRYCRSLPAIAQCQSPLINTDCAESTCWCTGLISRFCQNSAVQIRSPLQSTSS